MRRPKRPCGIAARLMYVLFQLGAGHKVYNCFYYTWLYNNTSGSLLVAILFHTIDNTTSALLPPYFGTEIGRWVNFAILLVTAVIVVLIWGWRTLNRSQSVPQPSLAENGAVSLN